MSSDWLFWYNTVKPSGSYQKSLSHRHHKSLELSCFLLMYHYQFDHELRARDEKIVASGLDLVGSFDENLEQMIDS